MDVRSGKFKRRPINCKDCSHADRCFPSLLDDDEEVEQFDEKMIDELDRQSNQRIADAFTWERIVTDYENLFKK